MSNVLSALAADMYKAADIVGRELVGAIPSVMVNTGTEGAAIGQTVRSHFTREVLAGNIAPAMTIPEGTDQTVDNKTMTITKQRGIQIPWTGEDIKFVNAGAGYETIYGDQIKQAMRTLVNEAEVDMCLEISTNASRAFGTSGTTPFASSFAEVAEIRQILVDNGAAVDGGEVSMILNTIAGTKLRNLAQLQKANESGSTDMLRRGTLLDLQGLMLKESAGIRAFTKGTGTGYTSNTAGYAIGATAITLITGSGTILKGDVVTFAGDTNQYIVDNFTGGILTIAATGLRLALAASAVAMTITNSYTPNFALLRGAAEFAMRPPASPIGGDAASDVMTVQDPVSGLVFEVSVYKGFKKAMILVGAAWGVKAWKPANIAVLKG